MRLIGGSNSPETSLQVNVLVASVEFVVALRQLGGLMHSQVDPQYLLPDCFALTRITLREYGLF